MIPSLSLHSAGCGFSLDGLSFHHANDAKRSVRLHSLMERWNGRSGQREGFPSLKAIIVSVAFEAPGIQPQSSPAPHPHGNPALNCPPMFHRLDEREAIGAT